MSTYTKDPDAIERFGVDWSARLDVDGATLSTVTWSATPSGLTLSSPTNDDTTASTLVAGGTVGSTYALLCRVTTSDGQTLDHTLTLLIQSA